MKRFLFLALLVCLLSSCPTAVDSNGHNNGTAPGPVESGDKPERTFSYANIVGAHTLYVAPKKSDATSNIRSYKNGTTDNEAPDTLYSIDDEGNVEEVPFLDENKEPVIVSIEVKYAINVNEDFVLMESLIKNDQGRSFRDVILTRKSDGAVFSMENAGYPVEDKPTIHVHDGSLYLYTTLEEFGRDASLKQVNLTTFEVKTRTLTSDIGNIHNYTFHIDADGNIAYSLMGIESRFIKASGGFKEISSPVLFVLFGKMFVWGRADFDETSYLSSVYLENDELKYEQYTTPNELSGGIGEGTVKVLTSGSNTHLVIGRTLYKIDEASKTVTVASDELQKELKGDTVGSLDATKAVSDNYFYASGKKSDKYTVGRVNLKTFVVEYKDLSDYKIKSINPTDTSVIFTADDFNTGASIVAELNWATGATKTLQTSDSSDVVIVLERID